MKIILLKFVKKKINTITKQLQDLLMKFIEFEFYLISYAYNCHFYNTHHNN